MNAAFRSGFLPPILLFSLALGILGQPAFGYGEKKKKARQKALRYYQNRPGLGQFVGPMRTEDPVAGLSPEVCDQIKRNLPDSQCQELIERFVDRIEKTYTAMVKPPVGLLPWLKGNPELRRTFWLALSPYYDDIGKAMELMDLFRREEPEKTVEFAHLAVAMAVVWDTDDAIWSSRYTSIWGVKRSQYADPLPALSVFRYFIDGKRQKEFLFKIQDFTWPILVYLVDLDLSQADIDWAIEKFHARKEDIGSTYNMVPYDYGKRDRKITKLGDRPYTLPNLLKYGGVCGDRAYFTTRVAKCFGIPAFKSSGLGVAGGMGHVFTWHAMKRKGRPFLEATGRYWRNHYYTGNVFDPHTRTVILDRTVAMMLDGAGLSYEKYIVSRALVRLAEKHYKDRPRVSLRLTKKALTANWFFAPGWKLLMRHVKDGRLSPQEGVKWANKMMKWVAAHPDLTYEAFSTFLGCIPRERPRKRQAFYDRAARVYIERPDLLIALRLMQGKELIEEGEEKKAMILSLRSAAEVSQAGRHILPLVKAGVDLADRLGLERYAVPFFEKLLKDFPKKKGEKPSPAFQALVRIIAPVYEGAGREKEADRLRKEARI
ncbi:MAG: hypothetical protein ACYTHM_02120 [Planctomycetota bacterium]|jgi:hypothetical protein